MGRSHTDEVRRTMTVAEFARETRIGRDSVYEAIRSGRLPVLMVGRRILIPTKAVDAFLDAEVERLAAAGRR